MKVLVTGGRGFIGRAVKDYLDQYGHEAVPYDLVDGNDIRDAERLVEVSRGCDSVIHMAGVLGTHELFDTPYLAIDVNITGTANVLEACKKNDMGFVGIEMPPVFRSLYTASKVAASRWASAYHDTWGIPVSHVRAFNAFGRGQAHGPGHPQKICPTFAVEAWNNRPLPVWGDGSQTVDMVHTSDLARLLVEAISYGNDITFDGGTGHALTVVEFAQMVSEIVGVELNLKHLPMRRGEVPTHIVAEGDGWDLLDWKPEFRYSDLVDAVESYKDWTPDH